MQDPTATVQYTGNLRSNLTHYLSGNSIITDAPKDNHGKGEAFSPTDLVATALAACMITVIGIHLQQQNIDGVEMQASVKKEMASAPRRISKVTVELVFSGKELTENQRDSVERIAYACPVAKSLHPDIVQDIQISYRYS